MEDLLVTTHVRAPIEAVWRRWTTEDGARFITTHAKIQLVEGGPYEWFLNLDADPQGRRGSEGSRVLSFEAPHRLEFTWTYPPDVAELRAAGALSRVCVDLRSDRDGTHVTLTQSELGGTAAHIAAHAYFTQAWSYVLEALKRDCE